MIPFVIAFWPGVTLFVCTTALLITMGWMIKALTEQLLDTNISLDLEKAKKADLQRQYTTDINHVTSESQKTNAELLALQLSLQHFHVIDNLVTTHKGYSLFRVYIGKEYKCVYAAINLEGKKNIDRIYKANKSPFNAFLGDCDQYTDEAMADIFVQYVEKMLEESEKKRNIRNQKRRDNYKKKKEESASMAKSLLKKSPKKK